MSLVWVTAANYIEAFKIEFSFNDGLTATVDLSEKMKSLPIYQPLLNPLEFKKFTLNPWTIEWENGADFSPDYLYRLAKEQENEVLSGIEEE